MHVATVRSNMGAWEEEGAVFKYPGLCHNHALNGVVSCFPILTMQIEPKSVDTIASMLWSSQLGCIFVASDSIQGISLMYIHTQGCSIYIGLCSC